MKLAPRELLMYGIVNERGPVIKRKYMRAKSSALWFKIYLHPSKYMLN